MRVEAQGPGMARWWEEWAFGSRGAPNHSALGVSRRDGMAGKPVRGIRFTEVVAVATRSVDGCCGTSRGSRPRGGGGDHAQGGVSPGLNQPARCVRRTPVWAAVHAGTKMCFIIGINSSQDFGCSIPNATLSVFSRGVQGRFSDSLRIGIRAVRGRWFRYESGFARRHSTTGVNW